VNQQKLQLATKNDRTVSWRSRPVELTFLALVAKYKPVVRVPFIGIVVSDAALLRSVLMDTQHFSKTAPGGTSDLWDPILRGPGLLNMSGVDHLELKRKLTPLFNGKVLDEMVGAVIRASASQLSQDLISGKAVDVVLHVERMAARVICTLSGYDLSQTNEEEILEQLDRARGLLRFVKLTRKKLRAEEVALALQELESIHNHISNAYDHDEESTIPHLLKSYGFGENEVISIITALIIAGTETVISHLPRFIQLLVTGGVLSKEVASIEDLIQEGLRVTVPTPVMVRGVVESTAIQGLAVHPGDRIILATTFACRRLGDFDPWRVIPKELRNLWFGAGVHLCIGMPLAQLEITLFTQELLRIAGGRTFHILESEVRTGTLTAGYSKLVIQCSTS
jgi:cytochrome P450